MTQNKSAQNPIPLLNPDFSHRLSVFGKEATIRNTTDAVDMLADQATSVLYLISGQFIGDYGADKYSDAVIFNSLDSVIASINDIKAIVNALHDANHQA